MFVLLNENGYVESYAVIGTLVDGIEVPELEDMEHFEAHYQSYGYLDGTLRYNDVWEQMLEQTKLVDEIRVRREKECFPVVNRGQLWYEKLTDKQRKELQKWYDDWLNATSTQKIPEALSWI